MTTATRVSVIGLGRMGSALARALLRAGHEVVVWNRTAERAAPLAADGAVVAGSPAEAIAASPLTLMCVLDYVSAAELLNSGGVAEALSGRTLVQLTSAVPDEGPVQHRWVQERGGRFLAGGIMVFPSAIGRPDTLIVYSGDRSAFEDHRRALSHLGGGLQYLGTDTRVALGAYCTAGIFALGSVAMFLESAALARHYGIPIDTFYGLSRFGIDLAFDRIRDGASRISAGRFEGDEASLEVMLAAMWDFCAAFAKAGIPARMTEAFTAQLEFASASGHGGKDLAYLTEALWAARRPIGDSHDTPAGYVALGSA